jgi:hypothetical protein
MIFSISFLFVIWMILKFVLVCGNFFFIFMNFKIFVKTKISRMEFLEKGENVLPLNNKTK